MLSLSIVCELFFELITHYFLIPWVIMSDLQALLLESIFNLDSFILGQPPLAVLEAIRVIPDGSGGGTEGIWCHGKKPGLHV